MKKYLYYTSIKSVLGKDAREGFFYKCINFQYSERWRRWGFVPFNYYEFGTGEGHSMKMYVKALIWFLKDEKKYEKISSANIFAFDSFKGLPLQSSERDSNPGWHERLFEYDERSLTDTVQRKLRFKGKFRTIVGYYEDSLTPELRKELSDDPPSIVNVDCDYYSSTKTVLEWIKPILQDGTIFHFDDIWEYLGNENKGEIAAIAEFNRSSEGKLIPFYEHGIPALFGKTFIYNSNKI